MLNLVRLLMADCENGEPLKITLSAGSGSVPTFCELVLGIARIPGSLGSRGLCG